MTPRDLQPAIVHARLRTIRELIDVLAGMGELTAGRLAQGPLEQLAVERAFTVVVEAAVDVNSHLAAAQLDRAPATYRGSFLDAAAAGVITPDLAERLAPSAGLRNILIHRYDEVDRERLVRAAGAAVDDYAEYVRQVAAWLRRR